MASTVRSEKTPSEEEVWTEEVRIMWITPEIAKQMLAGNERNRPKSDGHIDRYGEDMADGVWFVNGSTISFCDDERFPPWGRLMDGQTRLEACIEKSETFRTIVLTHASPDAWDTIDTGRRRSLQHVLAMHKYAQPAKLAPAARLLVRWDLGTLMSNTPPTANQVLRWLGNHDEVHASLRLARALARREKALGFVESVTTAFHYVISSYEPELSDKFHDELMRGVDLTERSGTYQLRRWSGRKHSDRENPSQVTRLAVTVKAWNAWVMGDEINGALSWRGAGYAAEDFPALYDRHGKVLRKKVLRRRGRRHDRQVPTAPGFAAMDEEVFEKKNGNGEHVKAGIER